MKIGDMVLYKGKPAKIFGTHRTEQDGPLHHIHIIMQSGRRHQATHYVSVTSKHLKAGAVA